MPTNTTNPLSPEILKEARDRTDRAWAALEAHISTFKETVQPLYAEWEAALREHNRLRTIAVEAMPLWNGTSPVIDPWLYELNRMAAK